MDWQKSQLSFKKKSTEHYYIRRRPDWTIIVVTRGIREDHEKKFLDVAKKLEDAGCQASEKNPSSF